MGVSRVTTQVANHATVPHKKLTKLSYDPLNLFVQRNVLSHVVGGGTGHFPVDFSCGSIGVVHFAEGFPGSFRPAPDDT